MPAIRKHFILFLILFLHVLNGSAQNCPAPSSSQLTVTAVTLNSARLHCSLISGATLYQFQYRKTGAGNWTIGSSSSQPFSDVTGLLAYTNYQFQCRIYCNGAWTAYSDFQSFTTNTGGNSCINPNELFCGSYYTGSSNTGNFNYTNYPFAGSINMTGPEAIHKITLVSPLLVTITMTPQSQDLDLFLLSGCGNSSGLGSSQKPNTEKEQISVNLNAGVYYIIVDGWNGAISNYNLNIHCAQTTLCPAPAYSDLYADDLTCSSVRLTCTNTSGYIWAWAYRPVNSAFWTSLPNTSTYFTNLTGLDDFTSYEFRCAVRCSNNTWSAWSPARQFTTPNCSPTNNSCSNPAVITCGNVYAGNNGWGNNNFNQYFINNVWNAETGPEMVYSITLATGGAFSVGLTGLSGDLDLFMLGSCSGSSVLYYSGNPYNNSEFININYLSAGTYKIVVDGYNNTVSNYTLSIQCNTTSGCATPTPSQLFASNLAGNAARINSIYQGAVSFDWRYRQTGATVWNELTHSSVNFADLTNLVPYNNYEFQSSVYCNGTWTNWSASQFFNTVAPYHNEPCAAYELAVTAGCYPVIGSNVEGSTSFNPTPPGGCNSLNMSDVWYKVRIPSTGRVKVSTFPGSLTNGLTSFYTGSCSSLTNAINPNCFDGSINDEMPDVTITGTPGAWLFIRVWGYDGTMGTFSICAQTANSLAADDLLTDEIQVADERDNEESNNLRLHNQEGSLKIFPVPAQEEIVLAASLEEPGNLRVQVANTTGQVVQEMALPTFPAGNFETSLDISRLPAGTYLIRVLSTGGEFKGKFIKM